MEQKSNASETVIWCLMSWRRKNKIEETPQTPHESTTTSLHLENRLFGQTKTATNDVMNIDVTDKQQRHFVQQQCHFVLISIKVPKKSQDVKTTPPPSHTHKPTNMLNLPSQQQIFVEETSTIQKISFTHIEHCYCLWQNGVVCENTRPFTFVSRSELQSSKMRNI